MRLHWPDKKKNYGIGYFIQPERKGRFLLPYLSGFFRISDFNLVPFEGIYKFRFVNVYILVVCDARRIFRSEPSDCRLFYR